MEEQPVTEQPIVEQPPVEQPVIQQHVASQPKPRRHWFRTILSILLIVASLTTIGCFTATSEFDKHIKEKAEGTAESFCKTSDEEAPEITLKGNGAITLKVGEKYEEQGATAVDSCEEVEVAVSGEVDTSKTGTYKITYTSMDSLQNVSKKERTVTVVPQYVGVIYLTFDDGPWTNTGALLDALKKYNVKATFFVTRNGDDAMIKREYDEGHTVALHTWSHDYSYVYASVENYFADLAKIQERVKRITGQTTTLIRFPGGSSNTVSRKYDGGTRIMTKLVQEVTNRGYTYFDWNISSGDAGSTTDPYIVYTNVIDSLYVGGEFVVLQHDTKNYSIEAIESIIQFGLKNGFKFERLTADSPTAHHHVNN